MAEAATVLPDLDLDVSPRDTRVEMLLREWNIPFDMEPALPLTKVRLDDAVQIRAAAHRAPTERVAEYVMHMKHGAIFPPIVIAANGMLVDGNTRLEATRKIGRKMIPAYRVKFPHLGMAKMIGAAINQMGGDRLSPEEIVMAAEAMLADGNNDEAIARHLGCSSGHVRNVRRDKQFREATERLELTHLQIPKLAARALAGIQHDAPFKSATEAVAAAKPAIKDIAELVTKVEKTRSDAEAVAVVNAAREAWGPVTGAPPHRSLSRGPAKKALRCVQDLITAGDPDPAVLVLEKDAAAAEAWRKLSALSVQVVALYDTHRTN